MKRPWFGAKVHGIGIGPKSLYGWLSILAYGAGMGAVASLGQLLNVPSWIVGATVLALTLGLFALMVLKGDGELWRWRWGRR
jgi:hypothetical protein